MTPTNRAVEADNAEVEAAARAICPACLGNDYNIPCAYPSEGTAGCLRDIRLQEERERNTWALEWREQFDILRAKGR